MPAVQALRSARMSAEIGDIRGPVCCQSLKTLTTVRVLSRTCTSGAMSRPTSAAWTVLMALSSETTCSATNFKDLSLPVRSISAGF